MAAGRRVCPDSANPARPRTGRVGFRDRGTGRPARQVQHPARAVRPASGDGAARRSVAHAVRHHRPPDAVDGDRGGRAAPDLPAGHRRPLPHAVAGRADAPLLVRRPADRQPPGAPRRLDRQAFRRRGGAGGEDQLRRLRPPAADPLAGRRPPAPHRRRHAAGANAAWNRDGGSLRANGSRRHTAGAGRQGGLLVAILAVLTTFRCSSAP